MPAALRGASRARSFAPGTVGQSARTRLRGVCPSAPRGVLARSSRAKLAGAVPRLCAGRRPGPGLCRPSVAATEWDLPALPAAPEPPGYSRQTIADLAPTDVEGYAGRVDRWCRSALRTWGAAVPEEIGRAHV